MTHRFNTSLKALTPAIVALGLVSLGRLPALGDPPADRALATQPALQWGKTSGGCEIGIAVTPTTAPGGESLTAMITLKNVGDSARVIHWSTAYKGFRLLVTKNDVPCVLTKFGQSVQPSPDINSPALATIKSGADVSVVIPCNRIYDMSLTGTYTIQVERDVTSPGNSAADVVLSPEIKVKVQD